MLGLTIGVFMVGGVEVGKCIVGVLDARGLAGPVVGWIYFVLLLLLGVYMIRDYASERRHAAAAGDATAEPSSHRRQFDLRRPGPTLHLRSCGIEVSAWVLAGMGCALGLLAGLLGVGGGFALVPALVFVIGTPTLVAVGTSLLCVMVSGSYGAYTYGVGGNVELIAAGWMLGGAVIGIQFGVSATRYVHGRSIRLLYGIMLLVAALGVTMKQLAVLPDAGGNSRLAPVVILGGALAMCSVIIGWMAVAVVQAHRVGDGTGSA
jgi:uncharacterized membrane protein YfcA